MKKQPYRRLGFRIDKLTNSIENVVTGETFATRFQRISLHDFNAITHLKWSFDWSVELRIDDHEVYALTTVENPDVVHGLISLVDMVDHIFSPLIESAPFNIGRMKQYYGVPGNLVAYACFRSKKLGYDGVVAFVAKTAPIHHYEETLYAKRFDRNRMFIDRDAAEKLISLYFRTGDEYQS